MLGESFGGGGALQLAINRKIYYSTADANYLAVINQPDVLGQECDYQANGVRVERCEFGLPQFIQSYFVDIKIEAPDVCLGDATFFTQSASADYDSILWEFGDGFTSTEDTPQHIYSIPGEYEITLTIHKENEIIVETANTVVYPLPEINEMVILKQCDDDLDGYSAFNLGEVNQELILNGEEYSISYYSNLSDAETGVNLISNTNRYINSRPSSDIIYARVENPIGCYRTAQVKLYVSTTQIPAEFKIQVFACDEMRDGIGLFDLTQLEDEISSIFPPNQQLDIMLYNSLEDALEEVNPVLLSDSYVNAESPYSQYLWVRVDSRIDNDCLGLGRHISLEVLEVPFVELKGGLLCEGNPLLLDAGEGFDSYQWSNGESTNSIVITEPGIYGVTATIEYEEITCEAYQEVEILGSGLADLIGVRAEGWDRMDNLVVVEASGSGDYEYSIDGVNFQDSPKFENIDPRFNTVYVNDKNGCGIVEGKFYILYYPRFFTPNGDGENDRWHLGNANMEHGYKVSIFNRYGRLITQLTSQSLGWDGTYMGRPSPSTDYWFVLERFDGKRFTGHFSLRR